MNDVNTDVKTYAKVNKVNLWEVSEALGYAHETAFSRTLRHELSEERKQAIYDAIDTIADSRR